MSELIDREAAISKIETWLYSDGRGESELNMLRAVIAELKSLPAAPRWHRVEDELPKSGEFGEIVFACNDVGTVKAAYLSRNGKWYAANNMNWDAWTWMPNVTNWMPMPEPPKEDA